MVNSEVVRLYKTGSGLTDLRKQFRVGWRMIRKVLLAAGVTLRSRSDARLRNHISTTKIVALYVRKKMPLRRVAKHLSINLKTVRLRLVKAGVKIRSQKESQKLRARDSYFHGKPRKDPLTAFWAKVNKRGPLSKHCRGRCWVWTASTKRRGYGAWSYLLPSGKRRNITAHRFSYELKYGPLPANKPKVCHHCDNPPCIRPSHLFAGTDKDNNRDRWHKGGYPTGEKAAAAVLTQKQARKIRELYAAGNLSQQKIANKFGITQATVSAIVLNKFYREDSCAA
jgi:predicted XRE-type DNA-binding protein